MISFLVAAAVVVVLALLILLRPLWRKSGREAAARTQLNTEIYRDELKRLDRDLADALIAQAAYEEAVQETKHRLSQETRGVNDETFKTDGSPKKTLLVIAILVPLVAAGMYYRLGSLPEVLNDAAQPKVTQQDVDKMVSTLAAKLQNEPDNYKGWLMLARSYKVLGRNVEAEQAFEHAMPLVKNDAQLLAIYADVAVANANGNFNGKPDRLLAMALKVDPENPMAQWLAGTSAFNAGNYKKAIQIWEHLAQQLPPESDDARMINDSIAEAREKGGLGGGNAPAKAAAASGKTITGVVTLSPALQGKVGPNDVVMIIAKPVGVRMPVAVVKARAADLPVRYELNDAVSMNPQLKLSSQSEVTVEARVSKTGQAMPEAGDLISAPQTVKVGAGNVNITVDQVRP